jgi:hypothetical protein
MLKWLTTKFRTAFGGIHDGPISTVATDGKTMAGQYVKVAYGHVYGLVGDPAIFDDVIGWHIAGAGCKPGGDWQLMSIGLDRVVSVVTSHEDKVTGDADKGVVIGLKPTSPAKDGESVPSPLSVVAKAVDNGGLKVEGGPTVIDINFALG